MPHGEKLYNELREEFNLNPDLLFCYDIAGHHYDPANRIIYFDLHDPRGWKWAIVHEFAHCVDHARRRSGWSHHHHDRKFYEYLLKVINFAYSDPSKYPWENEYTTVQRFAREDGYYA